MFAGAFGCVAVILALARLWNMRCQLQGCLFCNRLLVWHDATMIFCSEGGHVHLLITLADLAT